MLPKMLNKPKNPFHKKTEQCLTIRFLYVFYGVDDGTRTHDH